MPTLATLKPTLTPGYTSRRRIGVMTATVKATLTIEELIWVAGQWARFTGGEEDFDFNVLAEFTTPVTQTRVWICDRDGEESVPCLMTPSDY